jgi:hypothetical protein
VARANVKKGKSEEDRKKAVAMAAGDQVVVPLLAPNRYVDQLLSGLGALVPPCQQVSKTLVVSVSSWLSDP